MDVLHGLLTDRTDQREALCGEGQDERESFWRELWFLPHGASLPPCWCLGQQRWVPAGEQPQGSRFLRRHLSKVCRCLAIERGLAWLVGGPQRLQAEQAYGLTLPDLVACQRVQDAQDLLMRRAVLLIGTDGLLARLDQVGEASLAYGESCSSRCSAWRWSATFGA